MNSINENIPSTSTIEKSEIPEKKSCTLKKSRISFLNSVTNRDNNIIGKDVVDLHNSISGKKIINVSCHYKPELSENIHSCERKSASVSPKVSLNTSKSIKQPSSSSSSINKNHRLLLKLPESFTNIDKLENPLPLKPDEMVYEVTDINSDSDDNC